MKTRSLQFFRQLVKSYTTIKDKISKGKDVFHKDLLQLEGQQKKLETEWQVIDTVEKINKTM